MNRKSKDLWLPVEMKICLNIVIVAAVLIGIYVLQSLIKKEN